MATGTPQRASGALAYHVLEVLQAIVTKAAGDTSFEIKSTCERPRQLGAIRPVPDFR